MAPLPTRRKRQSFRVSPPALSCHPDESYSRRVSSREAKYMRTSFPLLLAFLTIGGDKLCFALTSTTWWSICNSLLNPTLWFFRVKKFFSVVSSRPSMRTFLNSDVLGFRAARPHGVRINTTLPFACAGAADTIGPQRCRFPTVTPTRSRCIFAAFCFRDTSACPRSNWSLLFEFFA